MNKKREIKSILIFITATIFFLLSVFNVFNIESKFSSKNNYDNSIKKLSISDEDTRNLPVLMYHSILKSKSSTYIIHPDVLKKDLIALKEAGFKSISLKELIGFVEGKNTLPEKPILITFDDGHYNNFYYALPLFKEYGFKGVINIIGAFSEFSSTSGDHSNPNYSHLTWDEIKTLNDSGVFEIGNHTYNLHKYTPRYGIGKLPGEDTNSYINAIKSDIERCQDYLKLKSGVNCICFAYPFGRYNDIAKNTLKNMGFKVIFNCSQKVNVIKKGDCECLLSLNRFNRDSAYSTKDIINKISI